MRQLTLTNVQFDVLHDIVKDVIDELKCDLDEQTLYTTETYKIYAQLNNLQSPKVTITSQQLEGDISTISDDDYADQVDTLVSKMATSNVNEYTHDSEGC